MLNQDNFPEELLFSVFSFLPPEDLSTTAGVSRRFRTGAKYNSLWKSKFETHFPDAFNALAAKDTDVAPIDWFAEFCKIYDVEYKDLAVEHRKLFSFVKEGDVESLTAKNISLQNLFELKDQNDAQLLEWAKKKNHQQVLDYFYQIVLKNYLKADEITVDPLKTDADQRTILHWAVNCKQAPETIIQLISEGADVNAARINGGTPLYTAARNGYLELVNLLIARNANVNVVLNDGTTALLAAAFLGYVEITKTLLTKGANVNDGRSDDANPLYLAAYSGHSKVLQVLLEHNAAVNAVCSNGRTALHAAAQYGHLEALEILLAKNANIHAINPTNGCTPLHQAAFFGRLEIVKALLARNVNVHTASSTGATALYHASAKGHAEIILALLAKNADVNVICTSGLTPLFIAVLNGHIDAVKVLLANNANVTATYQGATVLYAASQNGHLEIVNVLLEKGANVDAALNNGGTALIVAASNGYVEVVKTLLAHNANVNAVCFEGSALGIAAHNGDLAVVKVLLEKNPSPFILNYAIAAIEFCDDRIEILNLLKRQLLVNYLTKTNARADNHHKRSFRMFGYTFNFGCSAKEKKEAARDLLVSLSGENNIDLTKHRKALNNGELESIDRILRPR